MPAKRSASRKASSATASAAAAAAALVELHASPAPSPARADDTAATAAADPDAATVGVVSRMRGARPAYPSAWTLVYPIYRIFLTCFVAVLIHQFITAPLIAPLIYAWLKGDAAQAFIKSNAFFAWLGSPNSWVGARLLARGQDVTDMLLFGVGISAIHLCTYVVFNGIFYACDRFGWLGEYMIPRRAAQLPSAALIRDTLIEAALTSFVGGPIVLSLLFVLFGRFAHVSDFDSLVDWKCCHLGIQTLHFVGCHCLNELGFYIAHRAVHEVPGAYALIHRQHHRWLATSYGGISAEFSNPIEALVANILPTFLYVLLPFVAPTVPISAVWTWLSVRHLETIEAHSGYDLRGTLLYHLGLLHGSAAHHGYHHSANRGNYGSYTLDWLFGTMDYYVADEQRPLAPAQVGGRYDLRVKA